MGQNIRRETLTQLEQAENHIAKAAILLNDALSQYYERFPSFHRATELIDRQSQDSIALIESIKSLL